MEERVVKKLVETKAAVRKKLRTLRDEKFLTSEVAKEGLKPITDPLQAILAMQEKISEEPVVQEEEPKAIIPRSTPIVRTPAHKAVDKVYGPKVHNNQLYLGKFPITFTDNNIIVGDERFPTTRGLKNLIWRAIPRQYDDEDLQRYKQILDLTEVHRRVTGTLKGHQGNKYKRIIKPLLTRVGRGIIDCASPEKPPRLPSNPNKLCKRLRLLIASRTAGNTGHTNEINSIIRALRQADIIV